SKFPAIYPGAPVGTGVIGSVAAGAMPGVVKDMVNSGGSYAHSVTVDRIKDGSSMRITDHRRLDK
ncbi:MAG: hypothetical protein JST74_12790, partial [Bacteroidetes bacterium]|nr:hypothetical protein [Bacteroidota bacterium]